jgi:rhodanese-related sulfurtransferase
MKIVSSLFVLLIAATSCSSNVKSTQTSTMDNGQELTESKPKPVQNINQQTFAELQKDTSIVIIDVRTPGEIGNGYIEGADLFIDVNSSNFANQILALPKDKKYIVYCHSGARSSKAANFMVSSGFEDVSNLLGGITSYKGALAK